MKINEHKDPLNLIFFGKYQPIEKLGEGSFGKIYKARNIKDEQVYALKLETRANGQNLLESEAYIMGYLKASTKIYIK
jgi:serine/threonine protein kinase